MLQTKSHIRNFRHIVLMWFMVFSLRPCNVKKHYHFSADTAYAKPLNISKTTATVGKIKLSTFGCKQIAFSNQLHDVDFYDLFTSPCILLYSVLKFTRIIKKRIRAAVRPNIFYRNALKLP